MPSSDANSRSNDGGGHLDHIVGALIGPVFVVLAVWFVWGPEPDPVPLAVPARVDAADFAPGTMRTMMVDPPTVEVAGFDKGCNDCHQLFSSPPDTPLRLNQHAHIVQDHGMNDQCFNCHDTENRDRLVTRRGGTIPFEESATLCSNCHGTTYRDWQLGMHGRTTGSWDADDPRQQRLTCTQCHDPHAPAYDPMTLLAGPRTLRMGEPPAPSDVHDPPRHNPLRRWSQDEPPTDHDGEGPTPADELVEPATEEDVEDDEMEEPS